MLRTCPRANETTAQAVRRVRRRNRQPDQREAFEGHLEDFCAELRKAYLVGYVESFLGAAEVAGLVRAVRADQQTEQLIASGRRALAAKRPTRKGAGRSDPYISLR